MYDYILKNYIYIFIYSSRVDLSMAIVHSTTPIKILMTKNVSRIHQIVI